MTETCQTKEPMPFDSLMSAAQSLLGDQLMIDPVAVEQARKWQADAARAPHAYCVIDIETADAPEEAVKAAAEDWKAPSNWGDEAAQKGMEKHRKKISRGAALLDHAPIICVGIATEDGRVVFHAMPGHGAGLEFSDDTWHCIPCGSGEEALMLSVSEYLAETVDEGTVFAGHGILRFDLPKLRNSMARHQVGLPACLQVRAMQEVFDFEKKLKYFSTEHHNDPFPSFAKVMRCLGIKSHKPLVKGSDVPRLYATGEYEAILRYNLLDIMNEEMAYKMMTGGEHG